MNICLEAVEGSNKFERNNFEDNSIKKMYIKKMGFTLLLD